METEQDLIEGETYDMKVIAKNHRGEGIGRVANIVVFLKHSRARIGRMYKVRITNAHKTFAYAEPMAEMALAHGDIF